MATVTGTVEGQWGTDAALERAANALLAEAGEPDTFRASERIDGALVVPFGALEASESWLAAPMESALAGEPSALVRYGESGEYAFARAERESMARPPLGLPAHRPASRFRWAVGEGGYAPPRYSRDGVRVYRTLGTVKMMRLAVMGEALASLNPAVVASLGLDMAHAENALRTRVNRWMGATPRPVRAHKGEHRGAVKGIRRTAAEVQRSALRAIDITAPAGQTGDSARALRALDIMARIRGDERASTDGADITPVVSESWASRD